MIDTNLLHLGCGTDYRDGWNNVDNVESVNPDEVVDLNEYPWPWEDRSYSHIEASHVFEHLDSIEAALRECERILVHGGSLQVTLPMGLNSVADPDHKHLWTWQTPEFYCGKRHWDIDVGLEVVSKHVDLHTHQSGLQGLLKRLKWYWQLQNFGAGEWCFNLESMSGEFTVNFRKP